MAPSVLLLTTYPLIDPRHGGQVRARALVDEYKAGGFSVAHLAVVDKDGFPRSALGPLDIEFPTDDPRWFIEGRAPPGTNDLRAGAFAAESEEAYRQIASSIPATIDVFHLEQPWLLPLVERLKRELRYAKSLIVYGSQNIETPLRESIFKQAGLSDGNEIVRRVKRVETEACRLAQLTLAVSSADELALKELGAAKVLLAPNGIHAWTASPRLVDGWAATLKARCVALFVGSAHPPNISGFIEAFGHSLGCIPPDCRLVIAGGVGPPLAERYLVGGSEALNRSRLEVTGPIDEQDLAALKALASVFVLPVFEGGGSNIKTAEAIYSGKRVIATSASMRGYERYLQLKQLSLADTREDFQREVRRALSSREEPAVGASSRAELLWPARIGVVPPAVLQLLTTS